MAILSAFKWIFPTKSKSKPLSRLYLTNVMFRIHDFESQGLYSNPVHFYDFLQNRVMIIFRPKNEEIDVDHPEFSLTLSKKQNYDAVRVP
jgi:ICP0-binding domain of Ubiquitin-specific protease 7